MLTGGLSATGEIQADETQECTFINTVGDYSSLQYRIRPLEIRDDLLNAILLLFMGLFGKVALVCVLMKELMEKLSESIWFLLSS